MWRLRLLRAELADVLIRFDAAEGLSFNDSEANFQDWSHNADKTIDRIKSKSKSFSLFRSRLDEI